MRLKIRGKTILLMTASILVFCIAINILVYNEFNKYITQSVLTSDARVGMSIVGERFPGDWIVVDGNLYKGNKLINDNSELVDDIKKSTDTECTIFLNDTRISTTVLQDGKRAIGTKAADNIIESVLKNGDEYIGDATVLNKPYKAVYIPIKDTNGKAVGMFFIGKEIKVIINQINTVAYKIILTSAVMLVIIVFISMFMLTKVIVKPLQEVSEVMKKASKGDLTVRTKLKNNDEVGQIGQDINAMLNSLDAIILGVEVKSAEINNFASNLSTTSIVMAESSQGVATAIGETAQGAFQQAEDLSNITISLESFSTALESIYNSMTAVKKGSSLTEEFSSVGSKKLIELTTSIKEVNLSFDATYQTVTSLNDQINKIDVIATSIKSISDQTNLLSLNAAIEAARAGEAGSGFSVVAREIKALAEQSKQATEIISQLVRKIAESTEEVIVANNNTREKLNSQIETVNDTTESFEVILKSVFETTPILNKASNETDIAIKAKDSIVTGIQSAAAVAEQSSASTEEISAATEEMTAATQEVATMAERLQEISNELVENIQIFKV